MADPIILGGKKVGRLRASYLLTREAFRFLRADSEMLLVPVIGGLVQLFLLLLVGLGILLPLGVFSGAWSPETNKYQVYAIVFLMYLVSAFVFAYMQGIITHIVYTRAHNGDATLGDGFKASKDQAGALFIWACITSTVGILLRIIGERSQKFAQIMAAILGAAWSVLTYFVVPSIIIDKKSGFNAISHSGEIFKRTWGETIVINVGIGIIFFIPVAAMIFVLGWMTFLMGSSQLQVMVWNIEIERLLAFSGILFSIIIVLFLAIAIVLESVLKTLLYIYAHEGVIPTNFDAELLTQILGKKDVSQNTYPQGIAGS